MLKVSVDMLVSLLMSRRARCAEDLPNKLDGATARKGLDTLQWIIRRIRKKNIKGGLFQPSGLHMKGSIGGWQTWYEHSRIDGSLILLHSPE